MVRNNHNISDLTSQRPSNKPPPHKMMKNLFLVLATGSLLVVSTDAATAFCGDEACDVPLEMTCQQAADAFEFTGTCCSLVDNDPATGNSNCRVLITNGYCSWKEKGSDGMSCTEYEDGSVGCVVSSTQWESSSTDACPVSIYDTITSIEPAPVLYTAIEATSYLEAALPVTTTTAAPTKKDRKKKKRLRGKQQMMGGKRNA